MNAQQRDGLLIGTGAGLMLIVLVVLQSLVGGAVYGGRTATLTRTTGASAPSEGYDQVAGAYANHLLQLESRNSSAMGSGYESGAWVAWNGNAAGLAGNYSGSKDIGVLMAGNPFMDKVTSFSVSNESQTIAPKGGCWVVSSSFDFAGKSDTYGGFKASISARDSFVHVGGAWLVANETWNFRSLLVQYPVIA